jgi:hypothetical protein
MTTSASWKGYVPPDLQKTDTASADAAAKTPDGSFDKIIRLPLVKNKKYKFWFTYVYEDAETKKLTEGPRSPIVESAFDIPNLTKPVLNLTLTASYRAYGVKFDIDPLSVQEDIVIFESLTGVFAGEEYIVYVGNSTNVTIQTGSTVPRWVKVTVRDKWLDVNRSSVTAGPVTPLNPDPDTTYTVANPTTTTATAAIDPKDLSGFSVVSTMTWSVATDTRTAGYSLRWSTTNPSTGTPLWEYASVDGRTTNTFTATGLIPNTTYYYQVAAVTPYDTINWTGAATSTFIASDADGTAAGALARLKSFIAIGGASQDLFKIGTGIAQSINLNTDPIVSPTLTAGTYHGILLNKSTTNVGNNFWLTTGQFRVGNPTEFMYWNGTNLYLTGNINATGGKFTGNVQLAIPTGGTTSGTLYAGASPDTGARLRFNNQGLYAYDGISSDASVAITNAGVIDARKGFIGGWTISATSQTSGTISRNNTILDSNGNITVGDTTGTLGSAVRLSATDPTYRIWVGSTSSSNAPFRVDANGKLYATGAVFSSSSIDGYATTAALGNYATTTALGTTNANVTTISTKAQSAYDKAVAAADGLTALENRTTNAENSLALKVAATAVAQAINDNTTTINGAKITTGSIELNTLKVVGNTTNGLYIDNNGIRAYAGSVNTFSLSSSGALSLRGAITATSGSIGGFDVGSTYGDLTAQTITSVRPRIIFGSKILMGWLGSSVYGLQIGNSYDTTNARFIVNTADDVFRASIDTTRIARAFEVSNTVRAVNLEYTTSLIGPTSSRRFKDNITYLPKAYYEKILDIKPAVFVYKNNEEVLEEIRGSHGLGLIAEDLEEAGLGYFVQRDMQGRPTQLMDAHELSYLLIPIVKDMKEEIAVLKTKIETLENA